MCALYLTTLHRKSEKISSASYSRGKNKHRNDCLLTASRRGQDKRGRRRRSAAIPPDELSRENAGNMWRNIWQNAAMRVHLKQTCVLVCLFVLLVCLCNVVCAHLKQTIATCEELVALLRKPRLSQPRLESGEP